MNNEEKDSIFEEFDSIHFDAADREKVYEKINEQTKKQKSSRYFSLLKHFFWTTTFGIVTAMLLLSFLPPTNLSHNQDNIPTEPIEQVVDEPNESTMGLLVISIHEKNEVSYAPLTVLFSYMEQSGTLTLALVPGNLSVPVYDRHGKPILITEAYKAYTKDNRMEGLQRTYEKLLDRPIDFIYEMELEKFMDAVDKVGEAPFAFDDMRLLERRLPSINSEFYPYSNTFSIGGYVFSTLTTNTLYGLDGSFRNEVVEDQYHVLSVVFEEIFLDYTTTTMRHQVKEVEKIETVFLTEWIAEHGGELRFYMLNKDGEDYLKEQFRK
ncbi:hypothetical protein [Bacillus sp. FJAT-45066]|uniref:hypothetical protein n=1 Tax=Bacillus sp. FJAT-45066 TaxID=2011010 RepID=UPI000BB97535|nr:hypothetical protein [Bacillus sp. FJAT-45066]